MRSSRWRVTLPLLSGPCQRALRRREEHQDGQVLRDVEEAVFLEPLDEEDGARPQGPHFLASPKHAPPADDVIHLVLGMWPLSILLPGPEVVHAQAERGCAQKLQ